MKNFSILFASLTIILFTFIYSSFADEKYTVKTITDKNGYSYQTVTNDPLGVRIYTMKNGLKVYLAVNKDEPRIQTFIPVKAGSTYDPAATTGLAHYLEHMMFKGTSKFATLNWEKEKPLLDQISLLFEKHKSTNDPAKKKAIYAEIDSVSQVAAGFAIASEYDKMVSSLGAKGTNAYTTYERTVYINDIPANELEKWLMLESERFSTLVLRLFHTELEAVYEEFNMGQDEDYEKADEALMSGLFKKHPYGTQTTIGKAEHLKNPSMVNIHNYWNAYYIPNNMAICLSGDLDFDQAIQLIDKYFGKFQSKPVPPHNVPTEEPITKPIIKEVAGPQAEFVTIGYRFGGVNSRDKYLVTMVDMILSNSKAGLIDLDLVQQQKVLNAGSGPYFLKDYGTHQFNGNPKQGQSLEEVKDLIIGEIEKVKRGDFPDWILTAVMNDLRLSRIRQQESNRIAHTFASTFAEGTQWIDYVKELDELEKITKDDVVRFAKEHYGDNYVVVYKRTGKDTSVAKVEKPKITPVKINREAQSDFFKNFMSIKSPKIQPVFVDFGKEIKNEELKPEVQFNYIKNNTNELFYLYYIFDMGQNNDKRLPVAVEYLPYLGTDKYSPSELKQEFFKLGVDFQVFAADRRCYVYVSGLEKNMEKGMELFEHVLAHVKPDQEVYNNYVENMLKKRKDEKLNKDAILWEGLFNYGKYGQQSPFTNIMSEQELRSTNPEVFTNMIKEMSSYKHKVFYYGKNDEGQVKNLINQYHYVSEDKKLIPEPVNFVEQSAEKNKVFFVDYDMVQASILMLTKDVQFIKELLPYARVFSEFYGGGLSSIVFQEIRESKALAYSAFAAYASPARLTDSYFMYGYVTSQADKLKAATDAMIELMNNMPKAQRQYDDSRDAILKKIESERIIKSNIFFTYLNNMDKGIDYDIRKEVYSKVSSMSIDEFEKFFNSHVKGKNYTFLVIGNRKSVDMDVLKKLGEVKELSLEEIFNY